jgi:hypothetical protein
MNGKSSRQEEDPRICKKGRVLSLIWFFKEGCTLTPLLLAKIYDKREVSTPENSFWI